MSRVLIISTHLDDAVLSCGQYMAIEPGCTVLTVCAGIPTDGFLSDYDARSGFSSSAQAVYRRRQEDLEAMAVLDAGSRWMDYLDGQYNREPVDTEAMGTHLLEWVEQWEPTLVLTPLGIKHPDHIAVGVACERLYAGPWRTLVYEDLPYRVQWPELVTDAFDQAMDSPPSFDFKRIDWPAGPLQTKADAVAKYRSQMWALDPHCAYAPERYWEVV